MPRQEAPGSAADLDSVGDAGKEYLTAIYELGEEGQRVLQARIGERLGVAPATVSEGIKRLVAGGYVTVSRTRTITLTERGHGAAEVLVRRHRLAERLLVDVLGIPWHLCHEHADGWDKVITDDVERAILDRLGDVQACPHGNPIPGASAGFPWERLRPVTHLSPGERGTLMRLLEDVELDHDALEYLADHGLRPGRRIALTASAPDGTRILEVDDDSVALGERLAGKLWILPES